MQVPRLSTSRLTLAAACCIAAALAGYFALNRAGVFRPPIPTPQPTPTSQGSAVPDNPTTFAPSPTSSNPQLNSIAKLLSDAGLAMDIPDAITRPGTAGGSPEATAADDAFFAFLDSPDGQTMDAFINAAGNTLQAGAKPGQEGAAARTLRRTTLVRTLIAAQFARLQSSVSTELADKSLWLACATVDSYGDSTTPDIQAIASKMTIGALSESTDPLTDTNAQHWRRGLLEVAMQAAAAGNDASGFESYAARYLALPISAQTQEQRAEFREMQTAKVTRLRVKLGR